ncbi:MAG: beta-ketoacyl synthase chain length factor [Chitinophagales bacterium]
MSRIIKMGVAAALDCLREAGTKTPDAIITGTAYGCLEDTEIFLKKMVENKEELLTPTSFIQSTHNTVGAQIALLLQCHKYNNTHVHRGFSFENAVLDAMLLLQENEEGQVLVGGVDELTLISHTILTRFGLYRKHGGKGEAIAETSEAFVAGEGAGFFLLTNKEAEENLARLDGVSTCYKPADQREIQAFINMFLEAQSLTMSDIDLVISGENKLSVFQDELFGRILQIPFKNLCGEYPTSTAFALWYASRILKTGSLPHWVPGNAASGKIGRILIYNNHFDIHHALYLVSAC